MDAQVAGAGTLILNVELPAHVVIAGCNAPGGVELRHKFPAVHPHHKPKLRVICWVSKIIEANKSCNWGNLLAVGSTMTPGAGSASLALYPAVCCKCTT